LKGAAAQLKRVRKIALALPETQERASHSAPAFFVGSGKGKGFAYFQDDHHGDGRLCIWCAAPEGMRDELIAGSPDTYFLPPYVAHMGWVGVHLDHGISDDELAGVLEDAYNARC
jgi:hypothetical protein